MSADSEDKLKLGSNCNCPSGCVVGQPADNKGAPEDVVAVSCNNPTCKEAPALHRECFDAWQNQLLCLLAKSGRTRGWSDKQRVQHLWTKRGCYDIVYKACTCACGGRLRKDSGSGEPSRSQQRKNKRRSMAQPCGGPRHPQTQAVSTRNRTVSLGAAAGLFIDKEQQPDMTSHSFDETKHPERFRNDKNFFEDSQVKATGSIFESRDNLDAFRSVLPSWKINGIQIKLEDDCPQGNDDTHIFLLTNLGNRNIRKMECLLCGHEPLPIYSRYPLIDGCLFISPVNHGSPAAVPIRYDQGDKFLFAICVKCLDIGSSKLSCRICCRTGWFGGDKVVLGGLYTYDILAINPCCSRRCSSCHSVVPSPLQGVKPQSFSSFSLPSNCDSCGKRDFHHIRPMADIVWEQQEEKSRIKQTDLPHVMPLWAPDEAQLETPPLSILISPQSA